MKVTSISTHKITSQDTDIIKIIDQYITTVSEKSIIVITSKIIAITQGRIVPIEGTNKDELIEAESQWYLPRNQNPYNVSLTITNKTLIASAGIDESNGNGYYILWPQDVQSVANHIREHLTKKFNLKYIGVLITDSKTTPLRWGVTALSLGYSGFLPLKDYIGKPDIFGENLQYTKMSLVDNLSCAAAVVMGEGSEQTPLAIIEDSPVEFVERNPTEDELHNISISMEEDIYAPILKAVQWEKGKKTS